MTEPTAALPLTDEELARLRKQHIGRGRLGPHCQACGFVYPCLTVRLFAHIDAQQEAIASLEERAGRWRQELMGLKNVKPSWEALTDTLRVECDTALTTVEALAEVASEALERYEMRGIALNAANYRVDLAQERIYDAKIERDTARTEAADLREQLAQARAALSEIKNHAEEMRSGIPPGWRWELADWMIATAQQGLAATAPGRAGDEGGE